MKIIQVDEEFTQESVEMEPKIMEFLLSGDPFNESHIEKLYEYFFITKNNNKFLIMIMEILGKSLYEFLKSNNFQGFSLSEIQSISRQILEGVAYIHKFGVIHTDLKP